MPASVSTPSTSTHSKRTLRARSDAVTDCFVLKLPVERRGWQQRVGRDVDRGNPALQTGSGRWSLCRVHLEKQGYPYSYLRRVGNRGILSACSRELWRKYRRMA